MPLPYRRPIDRAKFQHAPPGDGAPRSEAALEPDAGDADRADLRGLVAPPPRGLLDGLLGAEDVLALQHQRDPAAAVDDAPALLRARVEAEEGGHAALGGFHVVDGEAGVEDHARPQLDAVADVVGAGHVEDVGAG